MSRNLRLGISHADANHKILFFLQYLLISSNSFFSNSKAFFCSYWVLPQGLSLYFSNSDWGYTIFNVLFWNFTASQPDLTARSIKDLANFTSPLWLMPISAIIKVFFLRFCIANNIYWKKDHILNSISYLFSITIF